MTCDPRELASHLDRLRRFFATLHDDTPVRDIGAGSVRVAPGGPLAESASMSKDTLRWYAGDGPLRATHLDLMIAFAREHERRRMFVWCSPWMVDAESELALAAIGAAPVPHVSFHALARRSADAPTFAPPGVEVRRIAADDAKPIFDTANLWYPRFNLAASLRGVMRGSIELFAAFINGVPAAISLLTPLGEWANLGGAFTDPGACGRGAQKALIAARLRRAAELGFRWCSSETSDTNPISLDNLKKCGFESLLVWRVFQWDDVAH